MTYCFNYSQEPRQAAFPHPAARSLLDGAPVAENQPVPLEPWGVCILESDPAPEAGGED